MIPDGYHLGHFLQQLAAVSEGFCPDHHIPLGTDGWCGQCSWGGVWWSIEHKDGVTAVAARYPLLTA